jgi:hypothetical protein
MWYGDPLMNVAELPVPQSASAAIWPPHARTTVTFEPVVENEILMDVAHCPVPDTTFWLT